MESRSSKIQERIKQIPEGDIFTFDQLACSDIEPRALAVIVSRLVKRGALQRISKGRYSKLRQSRFGNLPPADSKILESILDGNGRRSISYISGITAYNKLGLTTQVSSEVLIVGPSSTRRSKMGKLSIRYVRSGAPINEQTKDLL